MTATTQLQSTKSPLDITGSMSFKDFCIALAQHVEKGLPIDNSHLRLFRESSAEMEIKDIGAILLPLVKAVKQAFDKRMEIDPALEMAKDALLKFPSKVGHGRYICSTESMLVAIRALREVFNRKMFDAFPANFDTTHVTTAEAVSFKAYNTARLISEILLVGFGHNPLASDGHPISVNRILEDPYLLGKDSALVVLKSKLRKVAKS